MQQITVAVDAMSGDFGPSITVPAVERALLFLPTLVILLVADDKLIHNYLSGAGNKLLAEQRLIIVPCQHAIADSTTLARALRMAKGSSIEQMLLLLKEGQAQSVVSCGSSAFLMGLAKHHLGLCPSIIRPALLARFPRQSGFFWMLDLGANLVCNAEILYQFALMGDSFVYAQLKNKPRVALLNVGQEQVKGSNEIKQCAQWLMDCADIHYVGYIEADQLYQDIADVVVCDGFSGNVCLKSAEGLMRRIMGHFKILKQQHRWRYLLVKYLAKDLFVDLHQLIPDQNNGAILLGLNQFVVKSHGGANQQAFYYSILEAFQIGQQRLIEPFSQRLASLITKT